MTLSVGPDMSPEKTSIRVIRAHGKIMKETQVAGGPVALSGRISAQDGAVTARRA